MFTGIVQAKVQVSAIQPNPFGIRLVVDCTRWSPPENYRPGHGDSICISGVCLTVTDVTEKTLAFDIIAETLAKTTLGDLLAGSFVNIEPSVTPTQPMGGHFLQGHVEGVGTVTEVYSGEDEWRITIKPPAELMDYIIPKGSIAVDGVSMTLAAVTTDTFQLALIPTTLELTTLGEAKPGNRINIETDIISRTIVNYLQNMRSTRQVGTTSSETTTMELLGEAGFLE